jgi:hypothetical protein
MRLCVDRGSAGGEEVSVLRVTPVTAVLVIV